MPTQITDEMFAGLVCNIGQVGAIELRAFEKTLQNLPWARQKYLVRCFMALQEMPREAELERATLMDALVQLRIAWNKKT